MSRRRGGGVREWVIVCYSGPQRFCVCQILCLYIVMQPDKYFTPAVNTAQNQSSVFWEGTKQKVSVAAAACVYFERESDPFHKSERVWSVNRTRRKALKNILEAWCIIKHYISILGIKCEDLKQEMWNWPSNIGQTPDKYFEETSMPE